MTLYRICKGFYPHIEYLQDMSGRWTSLHDQAATFTSRSMAWDTALEFDARAQADDISVTLAEMEDHDFWRDYSDRHYNYEAEQ